MAKIIFEYTSRSVYASQGDTPSGMEGYNMWVQYPDDDMVHFLGFSTKEGLPVNYKYFTDNGDEVVLTKERNA